MTVLTVTDAKARFLDLVRRSDRAFERFTITRGGRPEAVLMSAEEFDGWLETLEILSDRKALSEIRRARRELKSGRGKSFEEVFGRPQRKA
ncbi:MAG: hypothetical protein A2Z34_04275 [Planctomycetes bacterium RBG_16_59_8]|nr:MAG: hypothetical protein A2Z34_04275 [Planctomycetes bacterium RBG_16_59_8]